MSQRDYGDLIARDAELGITSHEISDEIIAKVEVIRETGMMVVDARVTEMLARYDAALAREQNLPEEPEDTKDQVPYRSGPLRRTVRLGEDIGDYIVRLYFTDRANGDMLWVDFEIIQIVGFSFVEGVEPRREFYNRRNYRRSPDPVYTLDEAHAECHGFVKWDGCTELRFRDNGGVHICDLEQLAQLLDAIRTARILAAAEMPEDSPIRAEYNP